MLDALQRAELLAVLDSREAKLKQLSKPEKIFLGDSNLMHALVAYPDVGAIRETVFMNQLLAAGHKLTAPDNGDFVVDGRWLFEIGGPGKTFRQIAGVRDSFVVNDGVESGLGNKIPLWLFGFLY